ncbi:MAG: DUF485 domain-containing protein [Deltaproteobacteria bacterium]|nr:DUF485 domain-containing protein [Deltaproteobacteria bacterium]
MRRQKQDWSRVAKHPKFVELHRRKTGFLLGWWLISTILYLFLLIGAGTAPKLFSWRVIGNINFGYLLMISLFVYCVVIAGYYAYWANRVPDRITRELLEELKRGGNKG